MFIIERIPKVVRQFNPITSYYNDNQVKIDIIIGGSLDNDNNIINLYNNDYIDIKSYISFLVNPSEF